MMMLHRTGSMELSGSAMGRPAPPIPSQQTALSHHFKDVAVVVASGSNVCSLSVVLDSVFNQTLPPREIVVVLDNHSEETVGHIRDSLPVEVTVIETRCASQILSWRRGMKATSAPILCFLDEKSLLSPTFLEDSVPCFVDSRLGIVTGEESAWEQTGDLRSVRSTTAVRPANCFSNSLVRRLALEGTRAFECFASEPVEQERFSWDRIINGGGWEMCRSREQSLVHHDGAGRTPSGNEIAAGPVMQRFSTRASAPRIRAIFISSSFRMGGVVRHLEMLWKNRCHVDWIGSVLADGGMSDDASIRLIGEMMPVIGGVPADRVNSNLLQRRNCAAQALAELMNENIDIVYAWGNVAELVRQASRQLPVIFGLHGAGSWSKNLVSEVRDTVSAFVSVCEECSEYVPSSISNSLILNGVDLSRLTPVKSRQETRTSWGIHPTQIAIGFVGRWSGEKQPLALAKIVAELGPQAIGVYCCPQGEQGVDAILAHEKLQALDISQGRLVWIAMENAAEVYRALDCLLIPSVTEGGPLVALEAFACGCPVVATPVGMLPMLLREYGDVFQMVPLHATVREWGTAVRHAMTVDFRPNVEQARELAMNHFNAADMTRRWEEILLQSARVSTR